MLPAVAAAWRVPDPIHDLPAYLPFVVLAEVLTDGDASRLVHRMVLRDRSVTSVAGYIGFMGEESETRVRAAYAGATWDRLAEIKSRYDPTNLFRLNQNVPPA